MTLCSQAQAHTSENNSFIKGILEKISAYFCCVKEEHNHEPIVDIDSENCPLKQGRTPLAQQAPVHTSAGQDDKGIFRAKTLLLQRVEIVV